MTKSKLVLQARILLVAFLVILQPALVNAESLHATGVVERFYSGRNRALAWTGPANKESYEKLVAALHIAKEHGLDPADYHLAALKNGNPADGDAILDRIATDAYLTLAAHLLSGRLNPVSVEPDWTAAPRDRDLAAYLESSLGNRAIGESLEALAPTQPGYQNLKNALAVYREIADRGGWPSIAAGGTLRPGDTGARVAQLRRRLMATGDATEQRAPSEVYDASLASAVERFQQRANLETDGIVGGKTLSQLNKSVDERIAQIRANMERWRWLPEDLGRRHIRVNIADFRLQAYSDGTVEREHQIIVGRLYRKTPVFSGSMTYLVFNPWWETPPNLAVKDKLPAFRKEPHLVDTLGFQVIDRNGELVAPNTIDWNSVPARNFPFRIRQAPGPQNALGDVKFMFPNRHNVYLHDTPTRGLFAQSRRDFSSGCVRVQDALDLAAWVLAETPGWNAEKIVALAAGDTETRVNLSHPIPVHILYWTVVSDGGSRVRFLDDVYDRDQKVIAALDR